MNKVELRCQKDSSAKFDFGSRRIYNELKLLKIFLYIVNIIPVVFCFLQTDAQIKLICSLISFGLTLLNEFLTSFLTNHKEKGILLHQLFESEITGSTFSKIEYDRESTNELHELAIRKGLPGIKKGKIKAISDVPAQISDDYSYLYLCRKSAATTKYLLARIFYIYVILLIGIAVALISTTLQNYTTGESLYFLVCFWPLIIPIIRDCTACKKCIRQCIKISADVDNFFADGDASVERLARFYYYVQTIEFEMMVNKPTVFNIFQVLYNRGCEVLMAGVTTRFIEAINELKSKDLMAKGIINIQRSRNLITKIELDANEILEKHKKTLQAKRKALPAKTDSLPSDVNLTNANILLNQKEKKELIDLPSQISETKLPSKSVPEPFVNTNSKQAVPSKTKSSFSKGVSTTSTKPLISSMNAKPTTTVVNIRSKNIKATTAEQKIVPSITTKSNAATKLVDSETKKSATPDSKTITSTTTKPKTTTKQVASQTKPIASQTKQVASQTKQVASQTKQVASQTKKIATPDSKTVTSIASKPKTTTKLVTDESKKALEKTTK